MAIVEAKMSEHKLHIAGKEVQLHGGMATLDFRTLRHYVPTRGISYRFGLNANN